MVAINYPDFGTLSFAARVNYRYNEGGSGSREGDTG